jgi:hypothetical protein
MRLTESISNEECLWEHPQEVWKNERKPTVWATISLVAQVTGFLIQWESSLTQEFSVQLGK